MRSSDARQLIPGVRFRIWLRSRQARILAGLCVGGAYVILFFPAYWLAGPSAVTLAMVPVASIAWLLGSRAGLISGAICFPMNGLLLGLVGQSGWDVLTGTGGGALGSVFLVLVGLVVGWMGDLRREATQELASRREAEASLRGSEGQLRLIGAALEAAANGIIITDRNGSILWINPAFTALTGYSLEEVLGKTPGILNSGNQGREVYKELWETIIAGGTWRGELINRRKDGREYTEEMTITPLRGERGEISHFIAVKQDVTDRKRMQADLQEAEAKYRSLVEESLAGTYLIQDTQFIYVNPRAAEIFGYAPEEIIGKKTVMDLVAPESRDLVAENLRKRLDGELKALHYPFRGLRKNGHIVDVDVYGSSTTYHGQPAVIGTLLDITGQKEAENALRSAEADYRSIFDNAVMGIYRTSLEGSYLKANPRLAGLFGYESPKDLIESVTDLNRQFYVGAGRRAEFIRTIEEHGAVEDFESQVYRKDGSIIWVSESARVLYGGNGEVIGFEGTTLDITDRKRAEAAAREADLRAIREYERLLERLVELAQTVGTAHDLLSVYRGLREFAESSVPCDGVCVSLYDPVKQLRTCAYFGGDGQEDDVSALPPMPMNDSPQSEAILRKDAIITQDLQQAYKEAGISPVTLGVEKDPRLPQSSLALPLMVMDRVIGALEVQSVQPAAYTPAHVVAMRMAANLAAIATENVLGLDRERQHRLAAEASEEQARLRIGRLDTLRNIDSAITASLDVRLTLNVLLDHLTNQLRVDAADILLLNPHSLMLEFAAGRGFRTAALQHTRLRLGEGYAGRAALERRTIMIPVLRHGQTDFLRSPLFGEEGFVTCHAVPLVAKGRVVGVLEVFHRAPLDPDKEWLVFLEALAVQAAIAIDHASLFVDLQQSSEELALAYDKTLEGWSRALDLRDKETEGHTERVTEITLRLARAMGVAEAELVHLRRGGLLHDIGKMGIPDQILLKPGPLSEEEWEVMKRHPVFAYRLLSPIDYLRGALDIPYCHHEKWDGTGYPRGLAGADIPLAARLFAVADVYDALLSDRPYRKAWALQDVMDHVKAQAGKHFDPDVVKVFLANMDNWQDVRQSQPSVGVSFDTPTRPGRGGNGRAGEKSPDREMLGRKGCEPVGHA